MERLTAGILNERYGSVIAPFARVAVPFGWTAIIFDMMTSVANLPSSTRAFLMVTHIDANRDGLLVVDALAVEEHIPADGMQAFRDIVQRAVDRCAWTCERDGKPGWYTAKHGMRAHILCGDCQGDEGELHVA